MASSCFTNNCGCGSLQNGIANNAGSCGCNNAPLHEDCGCSQNLLGCALGGLSKTVYQVINGLDNTLCGCSSCGRRYC